MAPKDYAPGDVVAGRYRVERVVARGGMATIYAVAPTAGGETLALKVMDVEDGSGVAGQRLEREAKLLASIQHPHVLPVLDHGTTESNLPFLVSPLLTGRTLKEMLREGGALGLERAGAFAVQLLAALEVTHSRGVVHRDIKPDNIFVCEGDERLVLIDFGLAKAPEGGLFGEKLTAQGYRVGTPRYMSPEMARGYESEQASDLYALALVIAETIAGRPLAPHESAMALMMAHASPDSLTLPPEVLASPLCPVLQRALAKAPSVRYQTALQMRADVEAALAGGERGPAVPDLAATRLALPVAVPTPKRRRSWRLVAALLVGGVVLALLFWLVQLSP